MTAEQSIVIDQENLDEKDLRRSIEDKAVVSNDEGTSLILGSELKVGEELVFDVPLANASNDDANAIARLVVPEGLDDGLNKEIEPFWRTRTRSDAPSSTSATPTPAALTSVSPQSSDTVAATSSPSGVAGISPQVSTGDATTSSPGLPTATPQTVDASVTTTKPTGVADPTPQASASTATTTKPGGSASVSPQTDDGSSTTTAPEGLDGSAAERTTDFTATTTEPAGAATTTVQSASTTATSTRPQGAPDSKSGAWYVGTFTVDIDASSTDPNPKETVHFVLTDTAATSTYDTLGLSTDDDTFGATAGGPLSGQSPRQTGPDDDERITTSGTDVRLGPFYTFTVSFASDGSSANITSKTWFTAITEVFSGGSTSTVAGITGTDLDGDGFADDTFYAALTDTDSDGIYEKLDLSIGDQTFGEDSSTAGGSGSLTDGEVDFAAADPITANANDERLTATSETSSGSHNVKMGVNTFTFEWVTTPGGGE